jgi:hypothetical protein
LVGCRRVCPFDDHRFACGEPDEAQVSSPVRRCGAGKLIVGNGETAPRSDPAQGLRIRLVQESDRHKARHAPPHGPPGACFGRPAGAQAPDQGMSQANARDQGIHLWGAVRSLLQDQVARLANPGQGYLRRL